jgi:hypothetical protein
VPGTTRYLDRDFFHALTDPAYAAHLGIGPIDTGLSPQDVVACLMEHEGTEKVILDADNPIDTYLPAHEYATIGEHAAVRAAGGTPLKYERLKKAIEWCERKTLHKVPHDLACAPYLDEQDEHDKRALAQMKRLGVVDASKLPKEEVDYSESTGDRWSECTLGNSVGCLRSQSAANVCEGACSPPTRCDPRARDFAIGCTSKTPIPRTMLATGAMSRTKSRRRATDGHRGP